MPDSVFFDALIWPFYHVVKSFNLTESFSASPSSSSSMSSKHVPSTLDLCGHLAVMCGSLRAFLLSYIVVYYVSPWLQPEGVYPALGSANSFSTSWMMPVLLRNILATWIICGFWDWFLYFSPWKSRLAPYKKNEAYPPVSQFLHDAFYTTLATLMASLLEILYCYCSSNALLPSQPDSRLEFSLSKVVWVLLMTHLRVPHFYIIHRLLHPWRPRGVFSKIPDVGSFLYKHIYSLHHKSHNPTTFSGTSMHPVEALLYYSAACIPVLGGTHCTIVLACIIDCAIGAWTGHDGFDFPGGGDDFHQLHHAHFDCNYGTSIVAVDQIMGTAISNKNELKYLWEKGKRY